MRYWEGLDDQLRWLEPGDLNLECMGSSHLDCVSRVFKMAESFESLDNILHDWAKDK